MNLIIIFTFISYLLLINIISIYSLSIAKIPNAIYSTGISFSKINYTTSNACLCACINYPHCLSITVTKLSNTTFYCQLFATFPINSSQLSPSSTSNVTIYATRILSSVYINNGSSLTNPKNLSLNTINPWIPAFKLFTGNNQSFLWLNSSNLTTLTTIPNISINQIQSHWFSIVISQWNENLYIPNQVALAFIVNRTIIFDFLVFNALQTNITTWFSISSLISNQYWDITQFEGIPQGSTYVTAIYTDSDCIRSFNCNYKPVPSGCDQDFYGFFFVHGGYYDACVAAVRNVSEIPLPCIYYAPTAANTNGSLSYFSIADGIMVFVR